MILWAMISLAEMVVGGMVKYFTVSTICMDWYSIVNTMPILSDIPCISFSLDVGERAAITSGVWP